MVVSLPDHQGATSQDSIGQALDETAAQLEAAGATAARISQFDVAWPMSIAEQRALGGWTVLLISAVSADAAELPTARAYLHLGGRDVPLRLLRVRQVRVEAGSRLAQRVGGFREDAFYLAPIDGLLSSGDLRVDFAVHRVAFRVGTLPFHPPSFVIEEAKAPRGEPDITTVNLLLAREYTGFDGLTLLPPRL